MQCGWCISLCFQDVFADINFFPLLYKVEVNEYRFAYVGDLKEQHAYFASRFCKDVHVRFSM